MPANDEAVVLLDVKGLTPHPRDGQLPTRTERCRANAELKESILRHDVWEALVMNEKNRLIHGRYCLRAGLVSLCGAAFLLMFQPTAIFAQQANSARVPPTGTGKAAGVEGMIAEAQYRAGLDTGCYPLVEVFLSNRTGKPLNWKRAFLNGREIVGMTNGVVWTQFYPTSLAKPDETILLQVSLVENPKTSQIIEAETETGERIRAELPAFKVPHTRFTGVTFSADFRRAFVSYFTEIRGQTPTRVTVNGKDCLQRNSLMERPSGKMASFDDENPGLLALDLPEPLAQGQSVHFRFEFRRDKTLQCIVRASNQVFLDAFGIPEKNEKLRTELGLDLHPTATLIEMDPTCADLGSGKQYGKSASKIIAARKKLHASTNAATRLSYPYACTSATPNKGYSIYGQCCDGIAVNPYQLSWSNIPHFVESEENFSIWAWGAAQPRPWFWIPEAFTLHQRILEPGELRLLTYAALGRGCKGIKYFIHDPKMGFQNSKPLTAAIKAQNSEIRKLAPWLATGIPIYNKTIGSETNGLRFYSLACGDEGLLVIIRNLDYITDRKPNQMGEAPRFQHKPKQNVTITVLRPEWLSVTSATDPLTESAAPVKYRAYHEGVDLTLEDLDLVRVIWLQNSKDYEHPHP